MSSFMTLSGTQWPLTACEASLSLLAATRKSASGSLRCFSVITRPTPTRRTLDRERPLYQPSRPCIGFNSPGTRLPRFSSISSSSQTLLPPSGYTQLAHRRLVALSGPDAAKFLQGLITNNVDPARQSPFYAAFLDARGRMLWDVFIWTYPALNKSNGTEGGWACYIEVDVGEVDALMKHLKKHKLRSKIQFRLVEEDEEKGKVWAAWGPRKDLIEYENDAPVLEDPRFLSDSMVLKRSLVRPNGTQLSAQGDLAKVGVENYHVLRHMYGIPEGPKEIPRESALPMEYNVDLSQGIDFRKGCYVGQELTIRTKHTGVVRKRVLPVELYTSSAPPESASQVPTFDPDRLSWDVDEDGADIKQLDEQGSIKKGRAAGKLISTVGNVGLALCRLEMMTSMKISAEGGSWKPGMEFGVQSGKTGETVKVKPFVRDVFRTRERDIWDKNRTRI